MEVKTLKPKVNSSARHNLSAETRTRQGQHNHVRSTEMRKRTLPPRIASFIAEEDGRAFYEYVLVASLTVVVGIIVLLALGKGR